MGRLSSIKRLAEMSKYAKSLAIKARGPVSGAIGKARAVAGEARSARSIGKSLENYFRAESKDMRFLNNVERAKKLAGKAASAAGAFTADEARKIYRGFARRKDMPYLHPDETRKAVAEMKLVKKTLPKEYQAIKDALSRTPKHLRPMGKYHTGHILALGRLEDRLAGKSMDMAMKVGKKVKSAEHPLSQYGFLDRAISLARKGLLPAAAAGAGVAASRKPKAQGYAMGGMVKRSRKEC